MTFAGASYARVGAVADGEGYYDIESLPGGSYVMDFAGGSFEFVDLSSRASKLDELDIFEGTVTVASIANTDESSAAGYGGATLLGSATLKYIGSGDSTDRQIILRGNGTIDASGSGALALTAVTSVVTDESNDNILTLAGSGRIAHDLIVDGTLSVDLDAGGLTVGHDADLNNATLVVSGGTSGEPYTIVTADGDSFGGKITGEFASVSGYQMEYTDSGVTLTKSGTGTVIIVR